MIRIPSIPTRINNNIFSLHSLLKVTLILLIIVCVFDPGDELLRLKTPLFLLTWMIFILDILLNYKSLFIPIGIVTYLFLFIFVIPLTSIVYYFFVNGDFVHFDGFMYFKTFLFLTVVMIIFVSKIDLIKPTIIILTTLSIIILIVFVKWYIDGFSYTYPLLKIAEKKHIVRFGVRVFLGFNMKMLYVETTPLLVFPIGYFAKRFFETRGFKRIRSGILLAINIIALFIGATRNNMLFSILTPLFILYWYSRRKALMFVAAISLIIIIVGNNWVEIQSMLSKKETSNEIKLTFLDKYLTVLSDVPVLLFGQGLGSFFHSPRGYVSNSELTYFELVRRFGLILATVLFAMLLYPLTILLHKKYLKDHYIFICYFFYLVISASNPLLMSSTGMLLLSLVLFKSFSLKYPSLDEGRVMQ